MTDFEIGLMMSAMNVSDIEAAITFWEHLGLVTRWREPREGKTRAAGLGGESLQLLLLASDSADAIVPQSVYVTVTGVDAAHAAFSAKHPAHTTPVADRAFGMRDFGVTDAWGHTVIFGEAIG